MESPVAILCSGQGSQHPAMFDLVMNSPEAEPVFTAAAEVLGQDPRRFVREAAPADLFSDRAGQILFCAQALAARAGWRRPRQNRVGLLQLSGCSAPPSSRSWQVTQPSSRS